ncbi:hypothetical protein ScPMuIL_011585 [Solemya velum]
MSLSSSASDEADGLERKLDLKCLIESVGTLLIPSTGFVYRAVQLLVESVDPDAVENIRNHLQIDEDTFEMSFYDADCRHDPLDDQTLLEIASCVTRMLGIGISKLLFNLGEEYCKLCLGEYDRSIRMIGSNLVEFFSTLDGLQQYISKSNKFNNRIPPSFRCEQDNNKLKLHFHSSSRKLLQYYAGIVKTVAKCIFSLDVTVNVLANENIESSHHFFIVNATQSRQICTACSEQGAISKSPKSLIGVSTFCRVFPFHIILNRDLQIIQLGTAVAKMLSPPKQHRGLELLTYFHIISPHLDAVTFVELLSRVNSPFVLQTTPLHNVTQNTTFKGEIIYLAESDSILFLGSPSVEKLDQLMVKGLYISDLPIHDATRDVILVGEQTRAQDGLKKRMEQLKQKIIEASSAVEVEKKKNVGLLQMIFPENVAQKLWRNQSVEPTKVHDVTMLFSDIVGFTAICSNCSPLAVINMLSSLYTQFDNCCGTLDLYKVETIGDAYCVAGGLHRKSAYHAQQIAWMALRMLEITSSEKSPDGNTIKIRIGVHTGYVLAGVVGCKMPRYCLFGNNVTLANQFESTGEPGRINVSPTSHELLKTTPGFKFTERSRDQLPASFPNNIPGLCYFLDAYKCPGELFPASTTEEHITNAIKKYEITADDLF